MYFFSVEWDIRKLLKEHNGPDAATMIIKRKHIWMTLSIAKIIIVIIVLCVFTSVTTIFFLLLLRLFYAGSQ